MLVQQQKHGGAFPGNLHLQCRQNWGLKGASRENLKKRAQEMSISGKVSRTFEFLRVFGAEKSQGGAEKKSALASQ